MSAKHDRHWQRIVPPRLNRHPLDGTSFIHHPLETHAFIVDPANDYLCLLCQRPRALHAGPEDVIAQSP